MAGGMGSGRGIPMSRRVQLTAGMDDGCPARHCWVAGAADEVGVKRPGLLVEWRAKGAGWEGRVLYAAELRAGQWAVVEEWLSADLLTPR
ncbi:MAG TPA: hypothetical protein VER39_12055 [Nocardioidaceae bacterium]|nr:hypothetical protein [Nocardioidaceae bacterium]